MSSWRPGINPFNAPWPQPNDQRPDRTRNPPHTMRIAPQPSSFTGWDSHGLNDLFPPGLVNSTAPTHNLSQEPLGPYQYGNLFSHDIVQDYYATGFNGDVNQQQMSYVNPLINGNPTSNGVSLDNFMGPSTVENHVHQTHQQQPISPSQESIDNQDGKLKCRWEGCTYPGGFSREFTLERHVKSEHLYPGRFICRECLKKFKRKDNCSTHLLVKHGMSL